MDGFDLAIIDIKRKPFRSVCMMLIVFVMSFILFLGPALSLGSEKGLESTNQRLGADYMIVPKGYNHYMEQVLLHGHPSMFYLDKSLVDKYREISGVKAISSQYFLTSLADAACCTMPVQLIGYEPETDFVITPWISEDFTGEVKDGDLVVGSDITLEEGNKLTFFGREYTVVARLAETSIGIDASVYMNLKTIELMRKDMEKMGINGFGEEPVTKEVSSILLRVDQSKTPDNWIKTLEKVDFEQTDIVSANVILSGVSLQLTSISHTIKIVVVAIWCSLSVLLVVVFFLSVNERRKQFAILRIIGGSKHLLMTGILIEYLLIASIGSIFGTGTGLVLLKLFQTYVKVTLNVPYLLPTYLEIGELCIKSFFATVTLSMLAAVLTTIRIIRAEISAIFRSGE